MSASSQWAMELSIKRQRDGSQYLSIDRMPLPPKDGAEASEAMRARRMLDESIHRLGLVVHALRIVMGSLPERQADQVHEAVAAIDGERVRLARIDHEAV